MEIVGKDFRLDGGGYCTICEGSIDHPREKAIDTKRDLHLFAGPHPLEGRKYVCESCAREIAVVSGYIKEERAAALSEAEVEANTKLTAELLKLMRPYRNCLTPANYARCWVDTLLRQCEMRLSVKTISTKSRMK